jgi:hypothetical protein
MAFFCYICEEESTHICARCTKDSCDNHLCERCRRCSDCCDCEVRLDEQPVHPVLAVREREEEPVDEPFEAEAEPEAEPETAAFSEDQRF